MQRTFEMDNLAIIRVIGVGGGGSNAVNRMISRGLRGVEFVAVNTDAQALLLSDAPIRIRIGESSTRGLGSGGDPAVGEKAALESIDDVYQYVKGADMVFITAGMGGGTGTGAAPIIAEEAQKQGVLTIGVVTRPFFFEGSKRAMVADEGIVKLREHVDTLIVISNDRLLELSDRRMSLTDSFGLADDFLARGIQGISELITVPGLINLDFADVKAIMAEGGSALLAVAEAEGQERARVAAERAITSRLLDVTIEGARGILFNVTGGADLALSEVDEAASIIRETAHPEANVIFGTVVDENLAGKMRITVVATGFGHSRARRHMLRQQEAQPPPEESNHGTSPGDSGTGEQLWQPPRVSPTDFDVPTFLRRR